MTGARTPRGILLIDIMIGVAMMTIVFIGFFGAFRLSVAAVSATKGVAGASALVTSQMEHVRALPYTDIGIVGGSPVGILPGMFMQTQNGIRYTVTTNVWYAGASDYKAVSVTVSWQAQNGAQSISAVSYVSP